MTGYVFPYLYNLSKRVKYRLPSLLQSIKIEPCQNETEGKGGADVAEAVEIYYDSL